jgi:hypothetical protein
LEIDDWILSTYADVEYQIFQTKGSSTRMFQLMVDLDDSGHRVFVHDLVNDNWTSVLFGVPDEQISGLPESKMGPKHVAAHINAALRANEGGPRWRFKKCLQIKDTQFGARRTNEEPKSIRRPAVKLFIRERQDGSIIDVGSIPPSDMV